MVPEITDKSKGQQKIFFDRDISWLAFNERVLLEANDETVPLFERIRFLSIYSSNLDEFYRVRIPSLMALKKIAQKEIENNSLFQHTLDTIQHIVDSQLKLFGGIMTGCILPELRKENIRLLYNEPLPEIIKDEVLHYFFTEVLAFIQITNLTESTDFFPENNKLYKLIVPEVVSEEQELIIINIPSDELPRFLSVKRSDTEYIIFLDDVIKAGLPFLFKDRQLAGDYNFKVTRDAALELDDEYGEGMAERMEKRIARRDFSFATRFLFDATMPPPYLQSLIDVFRLKGATVVLGGVYHNLKDLGSLPLKKGFLSYPDRLPIAFAPEQGKTLFETIAQKDLVFHTPYHSYDGVLRFFNEASVHPEVKDIFVTLYRVAGDSRIAHALISAAKNGKKVTVIVELKARFDEANNIKWAKQMKKAGVKIIYSVASLKVHAKIALVRFKKGNATEALGLFATGNLNESTARFYTDHILMTADKGLLRDLQKTFDILVHIKKIPKAEKVNFKNLLVAKFNLRDRFIALIDNEIANSRKGLGSGITLKLNNLEEEVLIEKLYEASNAGVKINLILRGICCLIPGIPGKSENITVRRIVDRYLEHGRVFVFNNNRDPLVYMGSADWMNRNIYHRIEVCFPIFDMDIRGQILDIIELQLRDTQKAVLVNDTLGNVAIEAVGPPLRSQDAIYEYLEARVKEAKG